MTFVLLIGLLFNSAGRAAHGTQPDRSDCTIFGLSYPNVYKGTIYVCPVDLAEDPKWDDAAAGPVPFALNQALRTAREALNRFDPNETRWKLHQVSLAKIGQRWVYRVDWTVPRTEKSMTYAVTLSGRVIHPELDPK